MPRSAVTAEAGFYEASPVKRHRLTKAEVGERRQTRLHHDPRDDRRRPSIEKKSDETIVHGSTRTGPL